MRYNFFWKYLVFLSIITVVFIIIISQIAIFKEAVLLAVIGFVFMVLTAIGYYYASKKALASDNKMAFIQLVMFGVIIKIVLIMTIVAGYFKIVKPESKFFIIPFLIIYFIFTIFETVFTYKMAKS